MTRREHIRNQGWWPTGKPQLCDPKAPVIARIAWGCSGVQYTETTVVWWVQGCAYVRVKDGRWQPEGVWLEAKDVQWL